MPVPSELDYGELRFALAGKIPPPAVRRAPLISCIRPLNHSPGWPIQVNAGYCSGFYPSQVELAAPRSGTDRQQGEPLKDYRARLTQLPQDVGTVHFTTPPEYVRPDLAPRDTQDAVIGTLIAWPSGLKDLQPQRFKPPVVATPRRSVMEPPQPFRSTGGWVRCQLPPHRAGVKDGLLALV